MRFIYIRTPFSRLPTASSLRKVFKLFATLVLILGLYFVKSRTIADFLCLRDCHFNLFWLALFSLWQGDSQNTIPVVCFDLFLINRARKSERARKSTISPLNPVKVLLFCFPVKLSFSA